MVRGFYTAASGIITQEKKLNAYANNVANVATAGYKKDALTTGTFGEHMAVRMNTYKQSPLHDIGPGVYMAAIDSEYVDYGQGAFENTQRTLDMALQGEGFFVVADAEGNEQLTRDGQFALDDEGYLILPGYGRVQGEGGDIELGRSDFSVDRNGNIYLDPETTDDEPTQVDRLMIVIPDDYAAMKKAANGTFISDATTQVEENAGTTVLQYVYEKSNVDMSEEMTRIIASQRGLQSASQLVRMYDEMNGKANDTLGRVR